MYVVSCMFGVGCCMFLCCKVGGWKLEVVCWMLYAVCCKFVVGGRWGLGLGFCEFGVVGWML